jgi:hypothetical protein
MQPPGRSRCAITPAMSTTGPTSADVKQTQRSWALETRRRGRCLPDRPSHPAVDEAPVLPRPSWLPMFAPARVRSTRSCYGAISVIGDDESRSNRRTYRA